MDKRSSNKRIKNKKSDFSKKDSQFDYKGINESFSDKLNDSTSF
jgi:hypothetical protein